MKKSVALVVLTVVVFVACSKTEPKADKKSTYIPVIETVKAPASKEVFSDAHIKRGNLRTLINTLDAFPWEKKALHKIYSQQRNLIWKPNQIRDFRRILKNDSYLAMCGDRRYWDYLSVTKEKAKHDVLYSTLLLKYLNNLSSGCRQWVSSDGMALNENRIQNIKAEYVLSLLAGGALIDKLFIPYLPKNREFFMALKRYKALEKTVENPNDLKRERLYIEQYKTLKIHPKYD